MGLNLSIERLRRQCEEQIPERYPRVFARVAANRLEQEIAVIARLGQAEVFLAAAEISRFVRNRSIPCRLIGAGCSSIIAYLLGLTEVNPVSFKLLFERFRDPQGRWAPEFMLEIPRDCYQEVVDFATEHYGLETVKAEFMFSEMLDDVKIPYLAAQRVQREVSPAFDLGKIWRMCHFHEDRRVFPMLWEHDADGVFWLERSESRNDLCRLKPGSVGDVAAMIAVSMISAGHVDLMDSYVQQVEHVEPSDGDCRHLASCLDGTSGLILFQEQIMLLMSRLGKAELSDGYILFLAASKKHHAEVDQYRDRFVCNASKHVGQEVASTLFQRIAEAGEYACCKSHHVAEALTVYQAAFLKYHYPDQFKRVLEEVRITIEG